MSRLNDLQEKLSHTEGPADNLGSGRDEGRKAKGEMGTVKGVADCGKTADPQSGHDVKSDWNGSNTPANTNAHRP